MDILLGEYPPNTYEVVYPGVHSDVGGGYPQNYHNMAPSITSLVRLHGKDARAGFFPCSLN